MLLELLNMLLSLRIGPPILDQSLLDGLVHIRNRPRRSTQVEAALFLKSGQIMSNSDPQMTTVQVSNGALHHRVSPSLPEDTSFSREIYETLRKLLQHLIIIILLTSRLYMLPPMLSSWIYHPG